jgi:membrane protease YdiL (CAAX protease family)
MLFQPEEFLNYVRKPVYITDEQKDTNVPVTAIQLYLLLVLFVGLISFALNMIIGSFIKFPIDEALVIRKAFQGKIWFFFLYVVFFAPIIEETIFRLVLRAKSLYIALSGTFLTAYILFNFFDNTVFSILILPVTFIIIFRFCSNQSEKIKRFWIRKFALIYFISAFIFGFAHAMNYSFESTVQYFLIPVLVFPQLVMGLYYGFIRMYYRKGFLITSLIHIIGNTIAAYLGIILNS